LKERLDEYDKSLNTLMFEYEQGVKIFKDRLKATGITSDEFLQHKDKVPTNAKQRVQQLQAEIQQLKSDIEIEREKTGGIQTSITELREKLKQLKEAKEKKELEAEALTRQQGSLKREIQGIYERKKELKELKAQIKDVEREYVLTKKLNHYLESNRFPAYVSDYYLNAIVRRANHILFRFFSGKYILSTESSELRVIDKNLPDTTVSIDSLSGGEKVLVSMSIAMAITELTTNHIDMLFIDEGFSPLDNNNIQEVAKEIQLLESTNKVIGIVTHNQDFAEQFTHILKVENGRVEWQR
ncbi:MAG: SMC family ATPase, partial [Synergistetes bacterium]|nr:SMC family ATPase [Synergistota bacterium]